MCCLVLFVFSPSVAPTIAPSDRASLVPPFLFSSSPLVFGSAKSLLLFLVLGPARSKTKTLAYSCTNLGSCVRIAMFLASKLTRALIIFPLP